VSRYKRKKENLVAGQQFEEASKFRQKELEAQEEYDELLTTRHQKRKEVTTIDEECIQKLVSGMTGIPIHTRTKSAIQRVMELEDNIKTHIIGQDNAVKLICNSLKRSAAKIQDPDRPIGSFLFLGSTGVGKTYLAKLLSEQMFDSKDKIIQIDMSEMMEQHSVSKLIGSPPGYIGHGKGGKLTERVRRNPYSLVLFDEIEKASADTLHILLQILEEGKLTDSNGRCVNFKNTIVVMTTNIGADKVLSPEPLGFVVPSDKEKRNMAVDKALEEVRNQFRPEFVNRIDEMVVFNNLTKDHIRDIIDLNFAVYVDRIKTEYDVTVTLVGSAKDLFVEKGYSEKYGARELKRTIQRIFETKMSIQLLDGKYKSGDTVACYAKEGELKFRKS